jgi:hypothetical protein
MANAQTKYLMDETSNRGHLAEGIRNASFSLSMKGTRFSHWEKLSADAD